MYKNRYEVLTEVEAETLRFLSKIKDAKKVYNRQVGCDVQTKQYASAKRAALDLKNELTKLTQDNKYRYSDM